MSTTEPVLETRILAPAAPAGWEVPLGHRFAVGAVLGTTASVWWRHVLAFTAMSVVVYLPLTAAFGAFGAVLSSGFEEARRFPRLLGAGAIAVPLATLLLAVIQAGAVTFATVRHLSGERVRVLDMLRAGVRRGLPVVGVGVVVWLGTVLGTVLLVVPGVLFAVASCVSIPAAVVERQGVLGAIRRSFALTRGRRWALFAAGLAVLLASWVLAAVMQVGAAALASALVSPRRAPVAMLLSSQIGNSLFSALPLIAIAVSYHELRVEKEGVDTAALAKVFE